MSFLHGALWGGPLGEERDAGCCKYTAQDAITQELAITQKLAPLVLPNAAEALLYGCGEFVAEVWGSGEGTVWRFAPVSRREGRVWIHPTLAREGELEVFRARAVRIWRVHGSLWNPREFSLLWSRAGAELENKNSAFG